MQPVRRGNSTSAELQLPVRQLRGSRHPTTQKLDGGDWRAARDHAETTWHRARRWQQPPALGAHRLHKGVVVFIRRSEETQPCQCGSSDASTFEVSPSANSMNGGRRRVARRTESSGAHPTGEVYDGRRRLGVGEAEDVDGREQRPPKSKVRHVAAWIRREQRREDGRWQSRELDPVSPVAFTHVARQSSS